MTHPFAIAATCEAIVQLLRASHVPDDFGGDALEFRVCSADDLRPPITYGVSLMLYRVAQNREFQQIPESVGPDSRTERRRLAVELDLLLTAWAPTAAKQHELMGWTMRTLADVPVLTAPLLNGYRAGLFEERDTVELVAIDLEIAELLQLWRSLELPAFRPSIAYRARTLLLTSPRKPADGVLLEAGLLNARRATDTHAAKG